MDQLDEQSFLDELMSLRREEAPAPAPWQAYPGSRMMMTSDLLFYGGDGAPAESSDMDLAWPFQLPMAPPPDVPPHRPHEQFNFDCLSEVCNPYKSCVGVLHGHGIVHGDGQAIAQYALQLQDTMAENGTSGGKLHHGGGGSSLSPPFQFAGVAGESLEMTNGVFSGTHPRRKLNCGTTSKNLMAERRRRKRLNDRLSMLRSIVPKISKMDRTSILGDTIDYMNELTERIQTLEEVISATPEELNLLNTRKNFSSSSSNADEEFHQVCHREAWRCQNEDRHLLHHKPWRADLDCERTRCAGVGDRAMRRQLLRGLCHAGILLPRGREEPSDKHRRDQAGIVHDCRLRRKVSLGRSSTPIHQACSRTSIKHEVQLFVTR